MFFSIIGFIQLALLSQLSKLHFWMYTAQAVIKVMGGIVNKHLIQLVHCIGSMSPALGVGAIIQLIQFAVLV